MNECNKDDIIDVLFALLKEQHLAENNDNEMYVMIPELGYIIGRLMKASNKLHYLDLYDMPDLTTNGIKQSKFVDYVSLSGEIGFHMDNESCLKILARNRRLVKLVRQINASDRFGAELREMAGGKVDFQLDTPNTEYVLGNFDNGLDHRYNKFYTDGNIRFLEDKENLKRIKVTGATYAIYSLFQDNDLEMAVVQSSLIGKEFYDSLKEDARSLFFGNNLSYQEVKKYVYRKRKN